MFWINVVPFVFFHLSSGFTIVVASSLAATIDIPTEMSVSLINGKVKSEGIVRVMHNATWWTICDFQWDEREAGIVCRMLGYSEGKVVPRSTFRSVFSPMLWAEVRCEGTEQTLTSCWRRPQSRWPCNVENQAAVTCDSGFTGSTNVFDSSSNHPQVSKSNIQKSWRKKRILKRRWKNAHRTFFALFQEFVDAGSHHRTKSHFKMLPLVSYVMLLILGEGGWTSWFPWRPCSTECGQGVQHRFRWCDNTTNLDCTGSKVDVRPCGKQQNCDGSNPNGKGVVFFVWMNTFFSIFTLCALTLIAVISFKLWHRRQRPPVR